MTLTGFSPPIAGQRIELWPHRLQVAWRLYGPVLAALVALQVVVYSYFFTTPIFTDHTFPNTWVQPYPSHRTREEGRWFQDLIICSQGGAGVQSFQMFLAAALQGINGILFAKLLRLENRWAVFGVAAAICLYPAILDMYCFASDHLTFVFGDTLALVGMLWLAKTRPAPHNALVAVVCFTLSLAAYGPKIALIALLCLCHVAMFLTRDDDGNARESAAARGEFTATLARITYVAVAFAAACVCFYVSTKLTVADNAGMRVQLNTGPQMGSAVVEAYRKFLLYCTGDADYLPVPLRMLPAVAAALGCVALLLNAWRRGAAAVAILALLLPLIPLVLRASFIINANSFEGNGRISYVNGYALVFFLAAALHRPALQWCAGGMLLVLLYVSAVVGTQETNAAAMRTIYETNMINRLAARIEQEAGDLSTKTHALVVIGRLPELPYQRYVRYRNLQTQPHARFTAFPPFRQVAFLNFLLGQDVLKMPTKTQVERATASTEGRKPWPSPESVYVDGDVVVVLLQPYKPGVARTLSSGD